MNENFLVAVSFCHIEESLDKFASDTLTARFFRNGNAKIYHVMTARESIISMVIKNTQNNPIFFSDKICVPFSKSLMILSLFAIGSGAGVLNVSHVWFSSITTCSISSSSIGRICMSFPLKYDKIIVTQKKIGRNF